MISILFFFKKKQRNRDSNVDISTTESIRYKMVGNNYQVGETNIGMGNGLGRRRDGLEGGLWA